MNPKHRPARPVRTALVLLTAVAGFGVAALVSFAFGKTFVLKVAKNASVTNTSGTTKHESIVVDSKGFAVYTLTGDTAKHQKCKSKSCLRFWPAVKVSSASAKKLTAAPGVKGKLGSFRKDGFTQLTLAGHPLYTYAADKHKKDATGQGINAFGGIWNVVKAKGAASTGGPGSSSSSTTTSSTMTSSTSTGGYGY